MIRSYTSDAPIENSDLDKFNRNSFATRIANVIANRSDPSCLVISICGAWGEGKTSVLNLIENSLNKKEDLVCIKFNPWRFLTQDQMLCSFFDDVANGLYCITKDGNLRSQTEKWFSAISKRNNEEILPEDSLKGIKNTINEQLSSSKKKVVILVDDIDRLDKDEIQSIFKIIKLTADFSYTTYVLAFDEEMVAEAISEKYGSGSAKDGKKFLEKIIQVPLHLPKVDMSSLRSFAVDCINEVLDDTEIHLTKEQSRAFSKVFFLAFEPFIKTPRQMKRYGQLLSFSLPLLKGEVNIVDLMMVEALKIFYVDLYNLIKKHPEYFSHQLIILKEEKKSLQSNRREKIQKVMENLSDNEKNSINELLEFLFPCFDSIFDEKKLDSDYDSLWDKDQRLISGKYFDRYFTYAVTKDDISDIWIESFLKTLEAENTNLNINSFEIEKIISNKNIDLFIQKLRLKGKELSASVSKNLILMLMHLEDFFPTNYEPLFSTTSQASFLIRQLIENLPQEARFENTKNVIKNAKTLSFSLECFLSITQRDTKNQIFSERELELLVVVMSEKIKEVAKESIIYIDFRTTANYLLNFWAEHNRDESKEYVKRTLREDPSNVFPFIRAFCHRDDGFGFLNGEEGYRWIGNVADMKDVLEALKKTSNLATRDEQLKSDFFQLHQQRLQEYKDLFDLISQPGTSS